MLARDLRTSVVIYANVNPARLGFMRTYDGNIGPKNRCAQVFCGHTAADTAPEIVTLICIITDSLCHLSTINYIAHVLYGRTMATTAPLNTVRTSFGYIRWQDRHHRSTHTRVTWTHDVINGTIKRRAHGIYGPKTVRTAL